MRPEWEQGKATTEREVREWIAAGRPCQRCGGSGRWPANYSGEGAHTTACADCHGSGATPTEKAGER